METISLQHGVELARFAIEYVSGFSGPAVADLPAPPSLRDEWQCRTSFPVGMFYAQRANVGENNFPH
ncbi:MAG: hypothetical protein EWM73_03174 [Nitrospira sp.]|nr:MAG: hypothetical protein EWM73_03174 [Nitrospira sp.]